MEGRFKGLLVPMLTPFDATGQVDTYRAVQFGKDLLEVGVTGLALFGTTSEGQSLGVQERTDTMDALIAGGIPAEKLMVGTGSCALPDAIHMSREAVDRNCGGVLMLPPFFYKAVSDEGIFRFLAEVIEGVGNAALNIYLYHIPPVAHVGFNVELVARLVEQFPSLVVGLKNSSDDHNYSIALRESAPSLDVFSGSEDYLLDTLKIGGVGCISATGNVNARRIVDLYRNFEMPEAEKLQENLSVIRAIFKKRPMIPALKATVSKNYEHPQWLAVRPPLEELPLEDGDAIFEELATNNFYADQLFAVAG
tara:strand:- start:844 stop:1767 length:924 start_codon:yes stop_codon:yes gene_type:complete